MDRKELSSFLAVFRDSRFHTPVIVAGCVIMGLHTFHPPLLGVSSSFILMGVVGLVMKFTTKQITKDINDNFGKVIRGNEELMAEAVANTRAINALGASIEESNERIVNSLEASRKETASLLNSLEASRKETASLLNSLEASRKETASLLNSLESSMRKNHLELIEFLRSGESPPGVAAGGPPTGGPAAGRGQGPET